jgi:hypothetical protein
MFLTRHLVMIAQTGGEGADFGRRRQVERMVVLWGAAVAGAVLAVMLGLSTRIGVQSYVIVVLVVLDA